MMKRNLLLLAFFFAMASLSTAENVTVQTAQRVAQSFLDSRLHNNTDVHLIDFAEKASLPNLYVFGNEHCFVIISADNAVHPVLGYSIEGGFGTETMPGNTYEWLQAYDEEIAFATESRWEASEEILLEWNSLLSGDGLTPKSRNSVGPLLRTKWYQNAPFNNLCPTAPTGPDGHCYSGCVATAMAQVMNYWEHPVKGNGTHSYTPNHHPQYGSQYVNFGNTTYDWDTMKDYYSRGYNDAEALAVATLMYHCGVSINTDYAPNGSDGKLQTSVFALSNYFKYTSNMEYRRKSIETTIYYTDSQWIEMLKQDLDLERPILYRGLRETENVGHAFVCDGYDENDYFHFNWGWAGRCDGYFLIGALNPQNNRTENPSRTYDRNNCAIFNCYPQTPNITPPSNINSVVNGRNVTITWSNTSTATHYRLYRDCDLIANDLYTTSFTDNNVTYGVHSYYVKSVNSEGTMSLKSNTTVADVHFPGPMASNLEATVNGNNVNLSWQDPIPENAILQYGTGTVTNGFGYSGGTYWAHRHPTSTLSDYAGMAVEKVAFYSRNAGSYTISVYKGDIAYPTELLHQQSCDATAESWQDVVFPTPLTVDYTKDLWIVFYSETNNPASYCSYSGNDVADASLYSQTGQLWEVMTGRSWLIKTYITDGTYTYKLYRDNNAIATNINGSPYTNNNVPVGFYNYHITTNFFCGESDPSNTIRVRVGNPPCSVSATANPTNGGTIAGDGTYNYGSTCTLTATPTTGYDFIRWTKNGTQVSTNPNYSFTVTEEASAYMAHFQLKSFTINASANPNNGGTVSGEGTYNYGSTCTLTATPAIGYDFIKWTKNGTQVSTNPSYSFTVTEAASFVAHFQLQSFIINASANPNNGGTVSGEGTYNYGSTCTLTATPTTGYDFINWTKNGTQVSTSTSYSFTVTEAASFVAHFQLQSFTINASANPNNGGTVNGGGTYNYGSTCTLTATPAIGYDFIKWTKNGTQVSTSTSYSFTVTEAANFVAHFQLQSFTISATANPSNGGSVTGGGTYNYGQNCTLTATPVTGYDFINWTKNGTQVSTNPSYSFTVTEAASYVAHFQLQSFTINASANPSSGGTVNGGGTYNYGQTCTLTAASATGYDFINWTKNGTQVSTSTSYSFIVTEGASYVAHFQLQSFTINASASPNNSGTISGSGTYNYGQTCTLTATPSPGYTFLRWTKNGAQVSTSSSYPFTVMESASFVAHFQLNNYVINLSSNPSNGGTVSGGGAFHYGDNCTVTATTNSGFNFINWTENGNPVSNQPIFTFTVTSDRTLVANFTTQNYIITAMANPTEGGTVSGSGGYNYGDNCTLSATANTGYVFQRWTKNGTQVSTNPSYSFTVTESATFVAHFTMVDYTISVAASPTEGGSVSGGGTYNYGQTCTVHASANIGFAFIKWMENGTQVSDQPDYSFTVTGNRSLVAYFTPITYDITAEADPETGGLITGAGTYPSGGTAILSAIPNNHYLFQNWTEDNSIVSESDTYTFTVDRPRHLVAHFIFVEGINENHDTVELFPNPATDKLYIKGNDIKRVTIYNALGQLVEDHEMEHQDLVVLNVSSLKTGVYVIRIVTDQECVSKTFVKKN